MWPKKRFVIEFESSLSLLLMWKRYSFFQILSHLYYYQCFWCFLTFSQIKRESSLTPFFVADVFVLLNGVDFSMLEPSPFYPKWYSQKFNDLGVRYKIVVGISNGSVVWTNGPFMCGSDRNLKNFQSRLKAELMFLERVIADMGYPDRRCITPTNEPPVLSSTIAAIRARHETLNRP